MIHHDKGSHWGDYVILLRSAVAAAAANGTDIDVIGYSYYPLFHSGGIAGRPAESQQHRGRLRQAGRHRRDRISVSQSAVGRTEPGLPGHPSRAAGIPGRGRRRRAKCAERHGTGRVLVVRRSAARPAGSTYGRTAATGCSIKTAISTTRPACSSNFFQHYAAISTRTASSMRPTISSGATAFPRFLLKQTTTRGLLTLVKPTLRQVARVQKKFLNRQCLSCSLSAASSWRHFIGVLLLFRQINSSAPFSLASRGPGFVPSHPRARGQGNQDWVTSRLRTECGRLGGRCIRHQLGWHRRGGTGRW